MGTKNVKIFRGMFFTEFFSTDYGWADVFSDILWTWSYWLYFQWEAARYFQGPIWHLFLVDRQISSIRNYSTWVLYFGNSISKNYNAQGG